MTFSGAAAAIAPYVDNGVNSGDTRIAARLNEAQRRLIDQYNFLVRREQFEKTEKTYVERAANSTSDLILDNYDATKVMVLALWREENNELEMAATLEKKALDMVERDLVQEVESDRRTEFQTLENSNAFNTLGNLTGRVGLETLARYRVPKSRIRSYIRSAYRMAIDHRNFVIRREVLDLTLITLTEPILPNDNSTIDNVSIEVIRELVLGQMAQDQSGVNIQQ
jgi:hypothetical protein